MKTSYLSAKAQCEKLFTIISETLDGYKENPEDIIELLSFQSKFYQYSYKNAMLIKQQNPHATFVASYNRWKELGYSVKKGEKALKVLVPYKATVFSIEKDGEKKYKSITAATPDELQKIQSGEIQCIETVRFSYGNVFDISSTNVSKENYPKLYSMGQSSKDCLKLYQKIKEAAQTQGITVETDDVHSISLRGVYSPNDNKIILSDKLEDTERLSVLTHELGHAIGYDSTKTTAENELTADCLSILFHSYFGLEITNNRKIHLINQYRLCERQPDFSLQSLLTKCSSEFRRFTHSHPDLFPESQVKDNSRVVCQPKKPQWKQENRQRELEVLKETIPITQIAQMLGYTVTKKGRCFSLKEHDSVVLYPETNSFYRFSQGIGGSNIDFLNHFENMDDKEAIQYLKSLDGGSNQAYHYQQSQALKTIEKTNDGEFILPDSCHGKPTRAMAYLMETRKIFPEVVYQFLDDKKDRSYLYEDSRHNVVFVGKDVDGKDAFATRRSTLSASSFRGDIANSDQKVGFFVPGDSNALWICEAPIDLLSLMCLHKINGYAPDKINYLATCGTGKDASVYYHLAHNPSIQEVYLANDNDEAGHKANKKIAAYLAKEYPNIKVTEWKPSVGKDVNDYLIHLTQRNQNICAKQSEEKEVER